MKPYNNLQLCYLGILITRPFTVPECYEVQLPFSIRQIAQLAGVSNATVSRVINGSELVTPETTERIQKIIEDLKFVPNRSAARFKHGKSQIYGAIVPDLTNPFFMEMAKIFEELLVENDLEMLVSNTDFHPSRT